MDSTMDSSTFELALLKEMECPICIYFMHPPIRQCITGHSICNQCYSKVKCCPMCTDKLSTHARSYTLERLHAKLKFPCKYIGCNQIELGVHIKDHEQNCIRSKKPCPLSVINDCKWIGNYKDLVQHCREFHPNNIFLTDKQRLTCSRFIREGTSNYFYIIFNVFDHFFKVAWEINYETCYMRWCVFLMGDLDYASKFNFQIEFEHSTNPADKVIIKGPCKRLPGKIDKGKDIFTNNNKDFLITHYDMIKEYCKDGDLMYTVKICKVIE